MCGHFTLLMSSTEGHRKPAVQWQQGPDKSVHVLRLWWGPEPSVDTVQTAQGLPCCFKVSGLRLFGNCFCAFQFSQICWKPLSLKLWTETRGAVVLEDLVGMRKKNWEIQNVTSCLSPQVLLCVVGEWACSYRCMGLKTQKMHHLFTWLFLRNIFTL